MPTFDGTPCILGMAFIVSEDLCWNEPEYNYSVSLRCGSLSFLHTYSQTPISTDVDTYLKLLNETKNCFRDYSDYVDGMAGDSFATVRNVLIGLAWCTISKKWGSGPTC